MSDYRKKELGAVLDTPAPFYRLQVSADGSGYTSKHLNITHAELQAIRDLLECQHASGKYHVYKDGLRTAHCNDCDVQL